jgi:RNase H-fold protein (predicted Holliday junction resolvase)
MTMFLGIDYGLSHLGLAIAESNLIPTSSISNNDALSANLKLLSPNRTYYYWHPRGQAGVLKLPVTCRRTGVGLSTRALSTKEAKQKLREGGASKSKRRDDHAYAACLILEDYLEFGNSVN